MTDEFVPPRVEDGARLETIVFLQVLILVFGILGLTHLRQSNLGSFDLGPSEEALVREQELVALGELAIERLELIDTGSWPGRPTPWTSDAWGRWEYRYADDQREVCRRAVELLTARGVAFDEDDTNCAASRVDAQMRASGRANCGSYEARVRITVESPSHSWDEIRSTVRVLVEAPYPGMGDGHTLPVLEPVDCSVATPAGPVT